MKTTVLVAAVVTVALAGCAQDPQFAGPAPAPTPTATVTVTAPPPDAQAPEMTSYVQPGTEDDGLSDEDLAEADPLLPDADLELDPYAGSSPAERKQRAMNEVRKQAPSLATVSSSSLRQMAQADCAALEHGFSMSRVFNLNRESLPASESGALLGMSVLGFCPQHTTALVEWSAE